MAIEHSPNTSPEPLRSVTAASTKEFDLRDLIARLWGHRQQVITAMILAFGIALGIAFLIPRWYRATAVILPPEDTDLFSNMSLAQRALTKFPAFGVLGDYFTPADVFKAILKSRRVQEKVVDRFDLQKVYKLKSREKTLKALKTNYDVKLAPEGTIAVSVEDRDPKRAAAMATAFLEELDHFNIENRNTGAGRTRRFLEQRVYETDSLLRLSEEALKLYQEAKHTVVPTNIEAGEVKSAGELIGRKIALEVRLEILRTYLREDSDEIRTIRTELDQLKTMIRTLPQLQSELSRLIRDQKMHEQVFILLTAELEQARIREAMDTPTVQVLDVAVPPERHSRPKRLTIAIIAAVLTFIGATIYLGFQKPTAA
jgi:uncharacterized protein involved in exopolysaccharide biosynthesis